MNPLAWVYLPSPPNLLDLAIEKRKIITKQKALTRRPDGNEKFPYYRTTLSPTVGTNVKQVYLKLLLKEH